MPVYNSSNTLYSFCNESTDHARNEIEVENEMGHDAVINKLYENIDQQRRVACARLNVQEHTIPWARKHPVPAP